MSKRVTVLLFVAAIGAVLGAMYFPGSDSQSDFTSTGAGAAETSSKPTVVSLSKPTLRRWAYFSDMPLDSDPAKDMEWQPTQESVKVSAQTSMIPARAPLHDGSLFFEAGLHWQDLPQTAAVLACDESEEHRAQLQQSFCSGDGDCLRPNSERGRWFSETPVVANGFLSRWFTKTSASIGELQESPAAHCYQLWSRPLVLMDDQKRAAIDPFNRRLLDRLPWLGDGKKRALGPLHYPWRTLLDTEAPASRQDWLAAGEVNWRSDSDIQAHLQQRAIRQQQSMNQQAKELWQVHGGSDHLLWRTDRQQPYWPLSLRAEAPLQWVFAEDESLDQWLKESGVFRSALAQSTTPVQARLPRLERPDQLKQWLDRLMASGFDAFSMSPQSIDLKAWPTLQRYSDRVLDALAGARAVADVFVLGDSPNEAMRQALAKHGLSWLQLFADDYQQLQTDPRGYRLGVLRARALLHIPSQSGGGEEPDAISDWADSNGFIVWQYGANRAHLGESQPDLAIQTLSDDGEWQSWLSSMASDFRFRLRQPVTGISLAKWERNDALLIWLSNDSEQAKVLSVTAAAQQLAVLEPRSAEWVALRSLRDRWEIPLGPGESRWLSFNYQAIELPEQRRLQPVFETMMSVDDADFVNGQFETELELPATWSARDQGFSVQMTEIGGGVDVWVNGDRCGSIEFAPYRLALTSCAEPGMNRLRIAMRPPLAAAGSELVFLQHF